MPAAASRCEAKSAASFGVNSLLSLPLSLVSFGAFASMPPAFSASRCSLTQLASAAIASRVPDRLKPTCWHDHRKRMAMMHGVDHRVCVLERDEDAVYIHHLGCRRSARVDR